MIRQTPFVVNLDVINDALNHLPPDEFRYSLNRPTGNFFYDPWVLKDEFKSTPWETLYNSVLEDKGEARLIKLDAGKCYISHADIDDRYHLNLSGTKCFLINLNTEEMIPLVTNGLWYDMDAGPRHSATNFGNYPRYQLVIRKRLINASLTNPRRVTITAPSMDPEDARFLFDDTLSSWFNSANKRNIINDFFYQNSIISFNVENDYYTELLQIIPKGFNLQ